MIIKVYTGENIRNAHVQHIEPHPEIATYLCTANSTDPFDEKEYNVYVRRKDGVILAVPRPVR